MKQVLHLLRVNWKTLAGFEILYKVLSLSIVTPLFWGMFNGIMEITGYEYLTLENILSFLLNPLTMAALLFLFVCMAVYTMVDISAVIFLLDRSYHGARGTLAQTLRYAIPNGLRVFRGKNIPIAFVVLFLIPFLNLGVASSYVSSISVPEFILDFIKGNQTLLFLFLLLLAGLGALLLRWLYAFHYFTLEGCSFREARRRSASLGRKKKGKDLAMLLGVQFLLYLFSGVLILAGVFLAVFVGAIFSKWKLFSIVSASVVWVFLAVFLLIVSALGTPISYACVSALFYKHKKEKQEEIVQGQEEFLPQNRKKVRILRVSMGALIILSIACCSFYLYSLYNHKIDVPVEYMRTMEVTAHRGASRYYPENTMAAFEGARKLGADWIELDVQQSRDGEIFVLHDANLKRTTGVNKNIGEMDSEEIDGLDAGSLFSSEFAGERVPRLSEVVAFAKETGMKLNIEMKPAGHERDFEQKVVDIITAENLENQCVITSQVYEVLEKVKSCSETVQTVYVMSIAYGDINKLTAADHFSVEATSITERMVSDVHNAGKQLYAWTVNTEENINRMIGLNVDNIVTDDVTFAKECIFLSKTSDALAEYVKWLSD